MNASFGAAEFRGDGRGPELERLVWSSDGRTLRAAEYRSAGEADLRVVLFLGTQVVMITPEEVIGESPQGAPSLPQVHAYALDLGASQWLQSFNAYHLGSCSHYRFLFYDELLDVVCEGVEFRLGPYTEPSV